jgi:CelD/BcsL family acetyltransferase involved in cellulose biosynthesis
VSRATPYPFLEIDQTWTDPESHFNAGHRSDFRRAQRRANEFGDTSYEIQAPQPAQLAAVLQEAYAAELNSWKGRRGTALSLDKLRSSFYRRYFEVSCAKGVLRVALLRIAGRVVAMQLNVQVQERLWMLKIGHDENYARASPGTLLMLQILRYAAEQNLKSIEFLGSTEPWINLWAKETRECVRIRIFPWSTASVALLGADVIRAARMRLARRVSRVKS